MPPPKRPPDSSRTTVIWVIAIALAIVILAFVAWRAGWGPFGAGGITGTPPSDNASRQIGAGAGDGTDPSREGTVVGAIKPDVPVPAPEEPKADEAGAGKAGADGMPPAKYPVPGADAGSPIPAGENTDKPILDAILGLAPREMLARFLNLQDFVRRFVVTVDNLPRQIVPSQWSAVRRVPGPLAVRPGAEQFTLSAENYNRYTPFVSFVEALSPKRSVAAYFHFYPLLQQEYRQMGFPTQHFSDRVVAAIDDMLSAPEIAGPIALVQPKVLYRFADPDLEKLSAGRKIMIRIGPENAARLKKVLRSLRAELVGQRP